MKFVEWVQMFVSSFDNVGDSPCGNDSGGYTQTHTSIYLAIIPTTRYIDEHSTLDKSPSTKLFRAYTDN